jgi:broad specificity phosphatase PhoE/GNAT superfamily N-acetyltransferase
VIEVRRLERAEIGRAVELDVSEVGSSNFRIEDGRLVEFARRHERPPFSAADWQPQIDEWRAILDAGGAAFGVVRGGALAGIAVLRPRLTERAAQLATLYVDRRYRRNGIGRALVAAVERQAVEEGARSLYVSATPSDTAVPFYLSEGFEPVAEPDPGLFALEPDDIHMSKPLALRPRLWVVRHGETEWARLGRHTGRTDVPLTELGRSQAVAAGRKVAGAAFSTVLSSPLSRALDTARIAGFGDRVEILDDLREWDYGADEGKTTAEIRRTEPDWSIWDAGPHGGETIDALGRRADRVIARVRAASGDVLCFAHGHILRVVAARWIGLPPADGRSFALSTATVSVLGWERETAVIQRWNEACVPA